MTCSNCSCRCLCAWIVSTLLNLGFIGGIGWSLVKIWPVALGLSFLYIVVLALWIRRVHKAPENDDSSREDNPCEDSADKNDATLSTLSTPSAHESESQNSKGPFPGDDAQPAERTQTPAPTAIPLALSLLYALLVFALATPGAILALKAIPCAKESYYHNAGGRAFWTTDSDKLPPAVRAWYESLSNLYIDRYSSSDAGRGMFCQVGDTTYFSGKLPVEGTTQSQTLIAVSSAGPARQVDVFDEPYWLTQVTNTTCCFYSQRDIRILCGDKDNGFNQSPPLNAIPALLAGIDGSLWFRRYRAHEDGYAIVSLNPTTMEFAEYSDKHESTAEGDETINPYRGECAGFSLGQVIGGLLMVALPVTMISIWLWAKKGIPSSSFTLYVGLGLVCQFVAAAFDPYYPDPIGFMFWFCLGTPVWILVSAFVLAVNEKAERGGVVSLGLYSISSFAVLFVLFLVVADALDAFGNEVYSGEIEEWFILTVLAFIPLLLVGIVVKSTYIYILGVIGIMVIASVAVLRLSHLGITASASLAVVANLVLIFIGCCIHRKRATVRERIVSYLARCAGHTSEEAGHDEDAGLLLNAEAITV